MEEFHDANWDNDIWSEFVLDDFSLLPTIVVSVLVEAIVCECENLGIFA